MLGSLQGYLMAAGLQHWQGFQALALQSAVPWPLDKAWRHCNLLYRRLALFMASHAVKVLPPMNALLNINNLLANSIS